VEISVLRLKNDNPPSGDCSKTKSTILAVFASQPPNPTLEDIKMVFGPS